MSQYAIIGLGSFGATTARELIRLGHDVIGIDKEAKYVDSISAEITYAAIADATDEHVLRELNVQSCDAVLVAIGENLEASILCVLHLKTLGIKSIWVKAKSKTHHTILEHLGVSRIIHPEEEMGIRVAQMLIYPMVSQYMSLGDRHFMVTIDASPKLDGMSLKEFLDGYEQIQVMLIKRDHKIMKSIPDNYLIKARDLIVLEGSLVGLNRLGNKFCL
jgi:trk system potassium uptake protein TrkA